MRPATDNDTTQELRRFWPVVLGSFCVAVFAWGFGFYGQAVYLAELHRLRGWPTSLISSATTCFYLGAACFIPFVHRGVTRFGPRLVLLGGALLLGAGASGYSQATAPWHLFAASAVMALGWSATSGTAIATTLALWFDHRRGLAISLALNGASASGFTVAPALVHFSHDAGLPVAVPISVLAGLLLLIPIILLCVRRPPGPRPLIRPLATNVPAHGRPEFTSQAEALRNRRFWSVALPFALATGAQVGFIVHMVAFLLPGLGPSGTSLAVSLASIAAMAGRLGLGTVIDRLPQRRVSAVSFASQAVGLALMLVLPIEPWALFAGSLLFGLSVGNVITLPAILVHREFAARSFGLVVGLSGAITQFTLGLAPALFGVLRDVSGGYGVVLVVCISLQAVAAIMVLRPR